MNGLVFIILLLITFSAAVNAGFITQLDLNECGEGMFQCADGKKCIHDKYVCDNEPDCQDGSDESGEACMMQVCEEGEYFKCDGICVPSDWKCDGEPDCYDGTDKPASCDTKIIAK